MWMSTFRALSNVRSGPVCSRLPQAVEVASVVRASDSSFQVRWQEQVFEGGALKDTKRLTGLLSIVIRPPKTVEEVRKNPLGIYVHAFNWSQDVATSTGEAK